MSVGSTTVRVSWVPPPADSRNGVITQYSVAYEAVDGEDRERHVVGGIGREHSSWDLVGLEKWTEYRVWVRAHTDVGPGPESIPVLVRTDEDGRQRRGQAGAGAAVPLDPRAGLPGPWPPGSPEGLAVFPVQAQWPQLGRCSLWDNLCPNPSCGASSRQLEP